MNRSIQAIVFGAMLWTIASPTSAHTNDISETEDYQQLAGDFRVSCSTNEGGACFDLNPDAVALDLTIDDDITDPTGAYYEIRNAAGETIASHPFCGTSGEIDLTGLQGAAIVMVWVDGPIWGPLHCLGHAGIATTGSITATWHIPAQA